MTRAIRKHSGDFLALLALVIVALGVSVYILANQEARSRVPFIEKKAFKLTAEFAEFKPKAPKDELEGWRLGRNDDLVLAVAMSVWAAERFLSKEKSVPVGALGAA